MPSRIARVLVADKGNISMVARNGCVATVGTGTDQTGNYDELRIRCPRPERMAQWFSGIDNLTQNVSLDRVADNESEDADIPLPAAELVTANGVVFRVKQSNDASRLVGEVRSLSAELAAAEMPQPGPASPAGWQMLRVSGPAHVYLGGAPTTGVLEARVSTTGQYLCEFNTNTKEGPLHATKSGWLSGPTAAKAIDEVLATFQPVPSEERSQATFAAAVGSNGEQRANSASTAAVFEKFAEVQDALGDACLPELEAPKDGGSL